MSVSQQHQQEHPVLGRGAPAPGDEELQWENRAETPGVLLPTHCRALLAHQQKHSKQEQGLTSAGSCSPSPHWGHLLSHSGCAAVFALGKG